MTGTDIPTEVSEAFDSIFGELSADDKAEIAEADGSNTEAAVSSEETQTEEQQNRASYKAKQRAQEAEDELNEEGLISPNDPDGEGEVADESDKSEGGEETAEDVGKTAAKVAAPSDEIDPTVRLAANAMGWSDDRINRLYKADPELAAETMNELVDSYTNLSRQFLANGSPKPGTPTQQQAAQSESPTSKLDQFYSSIEEFADANGEDLANFAKALKAELIDPVREIIAQNVAHQQELQATEARTTVKQLSEKFSQFYGVDDASQPLTPIERNNRVLLGQVADQLRAGARAQGRELGISEAIHRAHLIVTANHRDQVVRKEIKGQVQTRAKGITSKPTQRRDPLTASGRSRDKALEAVSRKMAELGIEDYE